MISHAGTVVQKCFKDDNASQWKSGKFDPRSSETPEPIVTKMCMGDYVVDPTLMQNFITIRLPPFAPKYAKMRIK